MIISPCMESTQEIIEISSDEDEGIGLRIPQETGVHPGGKRKRKDCGVDDLPPGASCDVWDDDDCLILDEPPETGASCSEYVELGEEMVDEMLIVGEKGQLACRDYPHPRYLCATFLFSITPHKKHCDMCHCYVCDCPAPCIYWSKHCSSTHMEQSWRVERQLFRRRKREQQHSFRGFDVKPDITGLNRPVSKFAKSFLSPNDKDKSACRHGSSQLSHVKPSLAGSNRPISNPSPSLLSNEPKLVHQEPPCRSSETAAARPRDILCEIYKICPTVISCRRRIPPPLQLDELSDIDQDD